MAKVSFSKLGLKQKQDIIEIHYNDQAIEVKQYISVNEKLKLISNVINQAQDENNFINTVKIKMFTVLEMIYFYTNISFTDKQKEDPVKLYDLFISSGLADMIKNAIPLDEQESFINGVNKTAEAIYTYRNSVLGLLESISTDYSNLNLEASEIQKKIADPNNMAFLRDVLDKLG